LDRLLRELRIEEWSGQTRKILGERLVRHYLGNEQPEDTEALEPMTPRQLFFREVFTEFHEAAGAESRIKQSTMFLRKLRPGHARGDTISYHVEKHYEEIYVFKERAVAWLVRLERASRKRKLMAEVQQLRNTRATAEKICERAVRIRGAHTHRGRLRDDDIERVGSLDLIVFVGGQGVFEPLRRMQAQRALDRWRGIASDNLTAIEDILSGLLCIVEPIIFDSLAPGDEPAGLR
jgi:hypothetical protein